MTLQSVQETSRPHILGKKTLFQMRLLITHFFHDRWFSHTILYIHKLSLTPHIFSLGSLWVNPIISKILFFVTSHFVTLLQRCQTLRGDIHVQITAETMQTYMTYDNLPQQYLTAQLYLKSLLITEHELPFMNTSKATKMVEWPNRERQMYKCHEP